MLKRDMPNAAQTQCSNAARVLRNSFLKENATVAAMHSRMLPTVPACSSTSNSRTYVHTLMPGCSSNLLRTAARTSSNGSDSRTRITFKMLPYQIQTRTPFAARSNNTICFCHNGWSKAEQTMERVPIDGGDIKPNAVLIGDEPG